MTATSVRLMHGAQQATPSQSPDSKQEISNKFDKTDWATTEVETTTIPIVSEEKARTAVQFAFKYSNRELTTRFKVKAIVGFGANGVILAAIDSLSMSNVAIKIIYKAKSQLNQQQPPPKEISSLVSLNEKCRSKSILRAHCAWQDRLHFYLVTNLFGSNWVKSNLLEPLMFKLQYSNATLFHSFPVSNGASDLWAWSTMHRSTGNSVLLSSCLPSDAVKHIARSCFTAVAEMHESGFYHGDIKLENILVQKTHDDIRPNIMIADFGQTDCVEYRIMHYGTVEMSAPEFCSDSPFNNTAVIEAAWIDGRSADVFALGMVLFLLLSENGLLPAIISDGGRGYHDLLALNNGKFPFYDDEIVGFGEISLNLVNGMCRVDPAERFTLQQALKHKWFN